MEHWALVDIWILENLELALVQNEHVEKTEEHKWHISSYEDEHRSILSVVLDPTKISWIAQDAFAELYILSDGAADSIYLGDKIMGADGEVTGHPIVAKGHITNLVFGNPTSDEAWEGQIGCRDAGGVTPRPRA